MILSTILIRLKMLAVIVETMDADDVYDDVNDDVHVLAGDLVVDERNVIQIHVGDDVHGLGDDDANGGYDADNGDVGDHDNDNDDVGDFGDDDVDDDKVGEYMWMVILVLVILMLAMRMLMVVIWVATTFMTIILKMMLIL